MAIEFDPSKMKQIDQACTNLPGVQNEPTLTDLRIGDVHDRETTDWDIKVATHDTTQFSYSEAIIKQLIERGKCDAAEKVANTLFKKGHIVSAELLAKIK